MKLRTVNFGLSKSGLSTVGYTLYKSDGTTYAARSTSGVFEIGSTGIYGAKIDIPEREEIIVVWDTGGSSPRYGQSESPAQLDKIQEETDKVRAIWNTLKNIGDMYSKLLNKIDKIEKFKIPKTEKTEILNAIKKINPLKLKEIKDALNVTVKPEIKAPDIKIPDYSTALKRIISIVSSLGKNISNLERKAQEILFAVSSHKEGLDVLSENINALIKGIDSNLSVINDNILANSTIPDKIKKDILLSQTEIQTEIKTKLEALRKNILLSIEENTKIDKTVKDLVKADSINNLIKLVSKSNSDKERLRISLGIK